SASSNIPAVIREAFRLSQQERPSAGHIEFPEDIAKEEVEQPRLFDVVDYKIPIAGDETINQALELFKEAQKPILLIGAGANRKRASEALTTFVDTIGIPFFNTQMGKGIIDERHPLFLGTARSEEHTSELQS